jgi:hypothetical protein
VRLRQGSRMVLLCMQGRRKLQPGPNTCRGHNHVTLGSGPHGVHNRECVCMADTAAYSSTALPKAQQQCTCLASPGAPNNLTWDPEQLTPFHGVVSHPPKQYEHNQHGSR